LGGWAGRAQAPAWTMSRCRLRRINSPSNCRRYPSDESCQ
jgi:hypothetical protein